VTDLLIFVAVTGIVLGIGIWLGMLVAPRLFRYSEREDEEPGDDERG
jgi:hypothetical protein